jgi:methylated-DNA-[protein]-cysteine S-methyltransferase
MTADLELEAALHDAADGPVVDIAELAARHDLLDIAVGTHETPVGLLTLAWGDRGLLACSYAALETVSAALASRVSPRVLRAPRRLDEVRRALDGYLSGRSQALSLPVDLRLASPFARQVLAATSGVEYAATTTYGAVAASIGRPRASRAVGTALGSNPVCVVIPCHRVLRSGGELGGYAGGLEAKRYLLALEAARRDSR